MNKSDTSDFWFTLMVMFFCSVAMLCWSAEAFSKGDYLMAWGCLSFYAVSLLCCFSVIKQRIYGTVKSRHDDDWPKVA